MTTIEELRQQLEKERALRMTAEARLTSLNQSMRNRGTMVTPEMEHRWRLIQQTAGDNIWEYDFLSNKIALTPAFKALLGYSEYEFPDTMEAYLQVIHPDDVSLVLPDYTSLTEENVIMSREFRVRRKDGTYLWVLDRYMVTEMAVSGHPIRTIGMTTIIDRIKHVEQHLKETTSRMVRLISNLQSGILVEDENYRTLVANKVFCDMFDIPEGNINNAKAPFKWSAAMSKHLFADPYKFESGVAQLLEYKQTTLNEILETREGKIYSRDYIPVFLDGNYKGHLWRYTDISGQRRMESQLDAQRRFYEQILNEIPADIVVFDKDHHYKFLNPVAIKDPVLRKWMIGKTDEDYCRHRDKPLSIATGRHKLFESVVESRRQKEWEEKLIKPDGSVEYHLRKMYPVFDDKKKLDIVIGYGVNITERINAEEALRKSEEKYRGIIENMGLGMIEMDTHGYIINVNDSFCRSSGYQQPELLGKSMSGMFLLERLAGVVKEKMESPESDKLTTSNISVKDGYGVLKWWYISIAPIYNNEDSLIGHIIIQLDITQQKHLEDQLREAKRQADHSALTKESFIANISHEIRTPMNAIQGLGKLLSKTELNKQQHLYLDSIKKATENLLVIINDVLDFSKIEAGKLSIESIGFSLNDLLRHALYVMRYRAEEKGIALDYEIDPNLAPIYLGDPYRINQVMLNMLSNAVKFTEKGSVQVKCRLLAQADNRQQLCIQVIDTGVGMTEEYRKQLFEKFTQEDETVTRKFGGTGLGMSISRQLIELMGGYMEVESTKGKGTTISIYVGLQPGTADDLPKKEEHIIQAEGLKDRRILLVEDNEMNRLVATNMLKQYGANIIEAENGLLALDILTREKFDLILMDVQMPVMDGIETTIRVREMLDYPIPIIALTANALRGEQERCFEAGMNDYIIKPFEEEHIVQLIARWLGQDIRLISKYTPTSEEPYYDMSKLYSLSRGNEAFVQRMLQLFVRDLPLTVSRIDEAFHAGDLATVKALAHRIKPSVQNMGIALLKDDLPEMEILAAAGDPEGRLAPMVDKLRKISAIVVQQLKEKLSLSGS